MSVCEKINTLGLQVEFWLDMVLKDKIKISDLEKILGIAHKNSIIDTVILMSRYGTKI